ncbi:probable molybdopterin converting factor small subunit MoaD [Cyanidioschyzon merolae strain 10D]|jgi:molybdopterin converting factor small subunit|uniref:Probable molybdopterin converting factor small subunit MoaD n=1 Tax=Cyanidioschyzon merolae (strain NIES-3377 / 10D) TaxID=280699 RepID=M1VFC2_CYAM1|nr:probable molybdopterin converting factor small subunit MoaD [Cyanidioschyzon merolae strain 10D]BAM79223.1 probable molybdopterin converting factor small subunit MoaD [Cyanidioschyzon merolae strain 10D]|eukprot:XP_005535509.1 probable molybdopterin converting factor small subunit MoaD [Cyanidioschyzon merolae strain 10D]
MLVRVLLFAACRRAVENKDSIVVEVPAELDNDGREYCTVETLRKRLPEVLQKLAAHSAVAVNLEYAEAWQRVYSQDEVALIPPVSGG